MGFEVKSDYKSYLLNLHASRALKLVYGLMPVCDEVCTGLKYKDSVTRFFNKAYFISVVLN